MQGAIIIYCSSTNQKELFLLELGTIVCSWAHHRKSLHTIWLPITTLMLQLLMEAMERNETGCQLSPS